MHRMRNFMNRAAQFLSGRYGNDALNVALMLLAVAISVVLRFTPVWYLSFLCYVPMGWMLFRAFSRNIAARQRENQLFLAPIRRLQTWAAGRKAKANDTTHRYYKCPACKAQLRVPKGKGKICITCPKCRKEFVKKT